MNLLFLKLVQIELMKIFRKGRSYIGFGAIAFIVIVIQIALYVDGESYLDLGTQSLKESFTFQGNLLNGYLSVYIILSSLWVHIPFLIALVAGDLIAGEASAGTLRILLFRPISRTQVILAKFSAILIYVFAIVVFMAVLSIGTGLLIFGEGDLFVMKDMIYIFESTDSLWRILASYAFSFLSMSMVASLAFMLSSFVDSSQGPTIMTMSIIIVFMIISSVDFSIFRAIKPFMFTSYMGAWREFFTDPVDWQKIYKAIIALLMHITLFLGITTLYFRKKDILT
ncbi:MAG TPA: ABC transporter permease subunit [Bacteroidia bacterium]|nr:ABC transporter permease subunit [Bacteroidia bacterium]